MKTGLLAMATLPRPELATVRLPTLMVLGQPHMWLPEWLSKRLSQRQSSLPCRFCQVESPRSMKMGLLAMATLPLPEPATVMLPTLIQLSQFQASSWLWSRHDQIPVLMKTGLLAIATFPELEPEPAMVRLPTLIVLGRNQAPFRLWLRFCQNQLPSWLWFCQNQLPSWLSLRLCQNQSFWPNRFDQLHSPPRMKTGLLTMATLPALVRAGDTNQRPARLPSRCTIQSSPRLAWGGALRTP